MPVAFGRVLIDGETRTPPVNDWAQVTFTTKVAGVSLGKMPLPIDSAVTLICDPGTTFILDGPSGAPVGYAIQPLPWIMQTLLALRKTLTGR